MQRIKTVKITQINTVVSAKTKEHHGFKEEKRKKKNA